MIHNLNLDVFSKATEPSTSSNAPLTPEAAVSPEEIPGAEPPSPEFLVTNADSDSQEATALAEAGSLIPIDTTLHDYDEYQNDGTGNPQPSQSSDAIYGDKTYVDVAATEIPEPPQNRYDVHQDGSLTYFQYYFDQEQPPSGGTDYAPQTFSTSKFPTGVVGAGVLAATIVSGFMVAEAMKQPTRPLTTTALKNDTQPQPKEDSKTLTPAPSQPELLAPPKMLSVPLPPPIRTAVAPTSPNLAAIPAPIGTTGISGSALAANPQTAMGNVTLRPISVAPPEVVMQAAAGSGRTGTPVAQAPAASGTGEGNPGNVALTPATPESLATIVSSNAIGTNATNSVNNPGAINNGPIAQNPNPMSSDNPAISIETVPSLENSLNRPGANSVAAPANPTATPSTSFPPATDFPTKTSSNALGQTGLNPTGAANSNGVTQTQTTPVTVATQPTSIQPSNLTDRSVKNPVISEVSSQPPLTTMMPPTQETKILATTSNPDISSRTQVLNALRSLQDFLVVPQKLASTDQIELLPLNTTAAQEAQSSQQAGSFSVKQLSQADYVAAWKFRNASDNDAMEVLGFPPHGFIDYKQQQIVLPKLVVADKTIVSAAN
ncbi:hypothetical protein ACN4EG_07020 [Alkalinema pantanalense CENA528]|uniref:hypothetical protein n=1 Tax=Alkalinema pantanalense TaxID=1620705 RepID=UPI003D6E2D0E